MKYATLTRYAEEFCRTIGCDWKLVRKIGSGHSASVYKLSRRDQRAALKIYHPRFFEGDSAKVEKRRVRDQMTLKGHEHPHLIDFIEAGEIVDTCFLLMEYFPWNALSTQLPTIDRSAISGIIEKVASAAEYLDNRGFVHRDIKPANILVSSTGREVKLLDLGVIRSISGDVPDRDTDQGLSLRFVATAQYSSPAYLFRKSQPTEDMWRALTFYQLGGVLHDMLVGVPLFDREVRSKNKYLVGDAVQSIVPEVHADDVPARLVSLARNCLVKEDDVRLSRVGWDSFREEGVTDLDELRGRLARMIAPSGRHDRAARDRQRSELVKVYLQRARDSLTKIARHIFRKERFPQSRMREFEVKSHSHTIVFEFLLDNGEDLRPVFCLGLRLAMRDRSGDGLDFFVWSVLRKGDVEMVESGDGDLVWSTSLGEVSAEEEQLTSVLTDDFVRRIAAARDSIWRLEGPEVNTVEVLRS